MVGILLSMEKFFGIPPALLVALCGVESGHRSVTNHQDGGSPSLGVCQIKEATARMAGFSGTSQDLLKPEVNAFYAAGYLHYQLTRYGTICRAIAAYNSGSLRLKAGRIRNRNYVRQVLATWASYATCDFRSGNGRNQEHCATAISPEVRNAIRTFGSGPAFVECAQDLAREQGGEL